MIFPEEFFNLNLTFAQKVSEVKELPLESTVLAYTHLYLALGLDRSFNPGHPVWQDYLHGLREVQDLCTWTYTFYMDQLERRPPKPLPVPSFGCFSFTVWTGSRVRLHFRNAEPQNCSPLCLERRYVRLEELKSMFTYVKEHVESPTSVVGGSWLYNLDAYRRLFPPAFLRSAYVGEDDFPFIALWGQFVDRLGRIREDVASHFRENLANSHSLKEAQESFPFQVLRLESPIQDFYSYYEV